MTIPQPPQPIGGEERLFSAASFPEMYERALVRPLFEPWVDRLLDETGFTPGDRLLDVACGTGIVARRALERSGAQGRAAGVDVNPEMIAIARRVAPAGDWRQGDAGALPLRDGERFDVVLCQQGFQFFPDPVVAAREMRRALTDGGRAGASTWRPDEEYPFLRELRGVAERRLGPIADRRHAFGDPAPVEGALRAAGFRDVRTTSEARTIRFEDGPAFLHLNAMALVNMSAAARDLADAERQAIVARVVRDSLDFARDVMDGPRLAYELGTNIVTARA